MISINTNMTRHLSEQEKIKINDILTHIANDEDLATSIAKAIGEEPENFINWLDAIEV